LIYQVLEPEYEDAAEILDFGDELTLAR